MFYKDGITSNAQLTDNGNRLMSEIYETLSQTVHDESTMSGL